MSRLQNILFSFILLFALIIFTNFTLLEKGESAIDNKTISAQFTNSSITIDAKEESVWNTTQAASINLAMLGDLSAKAPDCTTKGTAKVMWDGAMVYVFLEIEDQDIFTMAERSLNNDGIEVYLDLLNDKFPKYEEDDGIIRVSADGKLSGTGVYKDRVHRYAASIDEDKKGYSVEMAINIGGVPQNNETKIGIEFGINDASSTTKKREHHVFWSSGKNNEIHDNTRWGTLELKGHNADTPKVLDLYSLNSNINKAKKLARGIWKDEIPLVKSLDAALNAQKSKDQFAIDSASLALDETMKRLRRKGKYPDPYDLPSLNTLPDPFTFFNGDKVTTKSDWEKRKNEIKDLAQYYEYGTMPAKPERVTATMDTSSVRITVEDGGKKGSFDAMLTLPTVEQSGRSGPFPVVVSIDFGLWGASPVYLEAGYAVLSVSYRTVASDNNDHEGAFYDLYPYDITTGDDAGTLLAWAWGASRGVDALQYLMENVDGYGNKFDMNKLVVTGFSRCGKAALCAGLFDDRFGVVSPGASGCGGAAVYRYDAFGNTPFKRSSFGNEYAWGKTPGGEVMGDKIRHQGHNSNEMLPRFLSQDRIYKTDSYGYGTRLPYDHHQILAAIAPRAVMITSAVDDYSNNAEGDCLSYEGAKPVYDFLGVGSKLALNIREFGVANPRGWGGGHWRSDAQIQNLVTFADNIFYNKSLDEKAEKAFYTNPYSKTIDKYYGGLEGMMPWLKTSN